MNRRSACVLAIYLMSAFSFSLFVVGQRVESPQNALLSGRVTDASTRLAVKGQIFLNGLTAPRFRSTFTDEEGFFHFDDVTPGIYTVSASAPGYLGEDLDTALIVHAKAELQHIDFQLSQPGRISGTLCGPSGSPLADTIIQLLIPGDPPRASWTVRTKANGSFQMAKVQPGSYYLRAIPRSARSDIYGLPLDTKPVYFPGTSDIHGALLIEVAPNKEVSPISLKITPSPAYSVTGLVVDGTTGKPVTRGALNANHRDATQSFGAYSPIGVDGTFRLEGLPAGHYEVRFLDYPGLPRSIDGSSSIGFELADKNTSGVVFTIKPFRVLRGHVSTDKPLGPYFSLLLRSRRVASSGITIAVQKDGSFIFPNVYPDDYDLVVLNDDGNIKEVKIGNKILDMANEGIVVTADGPLPDVSVVVSLETTTIRGRVVDEAASPQPGVRVFLLGRSDGKLTSASTDLNGRYKIDNLSPGEYWAVAWPRISAYALRDKRLFAKLDSESLKISSSPLEHDLVLGAKTRALAKGVTSSYLFPATRY